MSRYIYKLKRTGILIAAFFLIASMLFSGIENTGKGNLIGQIYDQDGTTPVEGASLAIRNLTTGKVYVSPKSEADGSVYLEDIEKGFYKLGVLTADGSFYAKDLMGVNIRGESTETISIAINPYSKREAKAVNDLFQEMDENEEAVIGHVLQYLPETGMAEVELIKGMLKKDAVVYIRGETNSFRQKVETIILNGQEVDEAFEGDIITINVKMGCVIGDLVYLCQKERILPFLLDFGSPAGIVIITAATAGVTYGIYKAIKEEPEASPYKPKK